MSGAAATLSALLAASTLTHAEEAAPAAAAEPQDVFDSTLSAGAYGALFSGGLGFWAGGHARWWLLDVTGERGVSGYAEYIGVHWRPEASRDPYGLSTVDSHFGVVRLLRNWHPLFYTFFTVGGSIGDQAFPRVQAEVEASLALPQHPAFVLSVGGGDRYYDTTNRPYLVAGLSYSLPKAAVIYRFWYDARMASQAARTHLLTLAYGQRLVYWLRLDLVWGNESHPGSRVPALLSSGVLTKGIAVSLEKWLRPAFGFIVKLDVNESELVRGGTRSLVDRWQLELQPFVSF